MVVALLPVELVKVKFWRVEEPATSKSPLPLMVVVAVVPIRSPLAPSMLAKRLVVVAALPVALIKVKFCRVDDD